jgi:hypothetical protein
MKEIATALAKAQGQFPAISLDREVKVNMKSGGAYTFRYATLSNILATVRQAMSANGLALSQTMENTELTTLLIHSSGEVISSCVDLPIAPNMTNQEIGAVITYFRRYCIANILGVCGDEDTDGNSGQNHFETKDRAPIQQPAEKKPEVKQEPKEPVVLLSVQDNGMPTCPDIEAHCKTKGEQVAWIAAAAFYMADGGMDTGLYLEQWSQFTAKKDGKEYALRTNSELSKASDKWVSMTYVKAKEAVKARLSAEHAAEVAKDTNF